VREESAALTRALSLFDGKWAIAVSSLPEWERVRVRGKQDAKNTFEHCLGGL